MVSTGVLKKDSFPNDKRKWVIAPTQILINEFESMHQERAEALVDLKSKDKIINLKSLQVI